MTSLDELYFHQLRDLYDAELQLTEALPKMAAKATENDLKEAFAEHLAETQEQVTRLERVFANHGMPASRERCEAMNGLIQEGEEAVHEQGDPLVNDAHLIAQAQRVEHYEIAGYGTVCSFAKVLGFSSDLPELEATLHEEKNADDLLTKVATGGMFSAGVNKRSVEV